MEYDFYGLTADHTIKLKKRLESLNKTFMKEYFLALKVINSPEIHEKWGEIAVALEDKLQTAATKAEIAYRGHLNDLVTAIERYL